MAALDDWQTTTIEECCDILDSKRVPVNSESRQQRSGDVPYYGANGLQGYIDGYIFDEPLILIAEDGGCFEEFATRAIAYRIEGKSWVNNHAHVLRAKAAYCQDAIFYALEHKDIQSFIVGGTRSKLNQKALRSITLGLPNYRTEQSKIAEVLSTVDRAVAQTEALIAKQQRIKTGLMQDLLTRGIDEHGQLRSEATHAFKDSPLGRIPVEWNVINFGNAGQWFSGGTPSKTNDRFWNGGVPWVCPKDMKQLELASSIDTITDYAVAAGARLMPAGTVFIVIRGMILAHTFPVGYAVCEMAFNQDIKAIVSTEGLNGRYLAYWLMSQPHEFLKLTTTATHGTKRFDMDELSAVPMRVPDLGEQEAILHILDKQQGSIDGARDRAEKLRSLKTALMQDLLTGKVRVTPLLEQVEGATT